MAVDGIHSREDGSAFMDMSSGENANEKEKKLAFTPNNCVLIFRIEDRSMLTKQCGRSNIIPCLFTASKIGTGMAHFGI